MVVTDSYYLNRQLTSKPLSSRSHLAHVQLFSTFACLAGGYNWNAFELSAYPRGLRTLTLSRVHFLRLCWLRHLQKGEFFS